MVSHGPALKCLRSTRRLSGISFTVNESTGVSRQTKQLAKCDELASKLRRLLLRVTDEERALVRKGKVIHGEPSRPTS